MIHAGKMSLMRPDLQKCGNLPQVYHANGHLYMHGCRADSVAVGAKRAQVGG